MISQLIRAKKGSVLAIDADPNSCLADILGIKDPETIVGVCDEVSKSLTKLPAGMTKDRMIEMRVQEALTEAKGFDLLVMGRPEGPGCYCYVNNLLRGIISKITRNYDFIVIDNAAGMEHISRRTTGEMNRLVLVSDYSVPGVRAARKIYELAKALGISIGGSYLVINKVSGPLSALEKEIGETGLDTAGCVPYDEEVVEWSVSNRPVFELESRPVLNEAEEILKKITE